MKYSDEYYYQEYIKYKTAIEKANTNDNKFEIPALQTVLNQIWNKLGPSYQKKLADKYLSM